MRKREGEFIREIGTLNKYIAGRPYKETMKAYQQANKERVQHLNNKWRARNIEKVNKQRKEYREQNKEKINENQRECYEHNKEKRCEKQREYYEKNKEQIQARASLKVSCPCGGKYCVSDKAKHFNTQKHINYTMQLI